MNTETENTEASNADPSPAEQAATAPERRKPGRKPNPEFAHLEPKEREKALRAAARERRLTGKIGGNDPKPAPANTDAPTRRTKPISAPREKASKSDVGALAKQVQGLHQLAALATGLPVLAVTEKEADILASAMVAVADEYGLSIDGKTGAAVQLFAALGMVYGPRVVAVIAIKKQRKAETRVAGAPAKPAASDTAQQPTADHLPMYEGDNGNVQYN